MEQFKFKMIPVPAEALDAVGLIPGTMAEGFVEGNRIIIQKADDDDDSFCNTFNEDCEGCPYCCPECGECLKEQIDEYVGKDDEND